MKIKSFDRLVIVILIGLGLILAALLLVGKWVGLPQPIFLGGADGRLIGAGGPFALTFSQPMRTDTVEQRLQISPAVEGRVTWVDQTAYYWPTQPLEPGQQYTLTLAAGSQSTDGRQVRKECTWTVGVREPQVLYLAPMNDGPELMLSTADGKTTTQLSQTGGRVYDYAPSPDGEQIVFSSRNAADGMDLSLVSRDGSKVTLLLDCGNDWCINPAWSPDGRRIAFSKRAVDTLTNNQPGVPRVWLLDVASGAANVLINDASITGFEPAWSPDGARLAFFDGGNGGVRVVSTTGQDDDLFLPSNMGMVGSWSPDGQSLVFVDMQEGSLEPVVNVYQADFASGSVSGMFSQAQDQADYITPEWSPDGSRLLVGARLLGGPISRQLWLLAPDGSGRQNITDDATYTNTHYRWSPMGDAVAYQRLKLGVSLARPEVVVWDETAGSFTSLAEDAGFPGWLP